MIKKIVITFLIFAHHYSIANHDKTSWLDAELLEIEIDSLKKGKEQFYEWAGYPISVIKLSDEQIAHADKLPKEILGDPYDQYGIVKVIENKFRDGFERIYFEHLNRGKREKENILVFAKISPYQGCSVKFNSGFSDTTPPKELKDFFFDPCSYNFFDIGGRGIKKNKSNIAYNLHLIPFKIHKGTLVIGNYEAIAKEEIISYIKNKEQQETVIDDDYMFYQAIGNNQVKSIRKYLINNDIDLDKPIYEGVTPFLYAITFSHIQLIKLFIDNGANFNQVMPSGHQVGCLSSYQSLETVEMLYKLGLNPNDAYCHQNSNCQLPSLTYDIINHYPNKKKFPLAIKYGFDVSKKHCGKSTIDVLKENKRQDILTFINNIEE